MDKKELLFCYDPLDTMTSSKVMEINTDIKEVGSLFCYDPLLDAMDVYKDYGGYFVTKNVTGMCGSETKKIYFRKDKYVKMGGLSYKFVENRLTCLEWLFGKKKPRSSGYDDRHPDCL